MIDYRKFVKSPRLILTLLLLLSAVSAHSDNSAGAPTLAINEIAWMGTKDNFRHEWLEISNDGEQKINLNGWKMKLNDFVLELKGEIGPKDYFLVAASDKIFENYDLNYANLGAKLPNKGAKVVLMGKEGSVVDEVDSSSGWFAGNNKTKQTMERINVQSPASDPNNWQSSREPGGTPRAPNSPEVNLSAKFGASVKDENLDVIKNELLSEREFPAKNYFPFIVAFPAAIFSALMILILKRKLKKD